MKKAVICGLAAFVLFAFIGCPADSDTNEKETKPPGIKLKVNGIPASVNIFAGTLLDADSQPLAAAMNNNGSFTFSEYLGGKSLGDPFAELGEYYIILANTFDGSGINYTYVAETEMAPDMKIPAVYNFQSLNVTLDWTDFADQALFAVR